MKNAAGIGLLAFFLILFTPGLNARAEIDPHFKPLTERLIKSGFERDWIETLFHQECARLYPKVLVLRLTVRESKINYAQFYEPGPIQKCLNFMAKNQKALVVASEAHKVPPEIITAILLLETNLGAFDAIFPTLRTLATHCVGGDKAVVDKIYDQLSPKSKKRWTKQAATARLAERAPWFYGELTAFLKYLKESGRKSCEVNGSYTGAIGFCQFQPSNLEPYGRDGNGDGVVDLFLMEDAIMSVGAYFEGHGWKEGMNDAQQVQVVKAYNNSTRYAQTILEVAKRLKK